MKLLYFYDALCGWCYGFSPVIQKAYEEYKDKMEFEVVSGGMIIGQRIGPIGHVAPYIKTAFKDVESASGVKFGEKFINDVLEEGSTVFSSIKPGIALTVFKSYHPEKQVEFARRLHKAVYYDGIEPDKISSYKYLAEEYGMDPDEFINSSKKQIMNLN
jgi:putative protein-disulfide isomerase